MPISNDKKTAIASAAYGVGFYDDNFPEDKSVAFIKEQAAAHCQTIKAMTNFLKKGIIW